MTAIDHISLEIAQGEFVAIVGRSGSGKTTLLNMLAGIDRPTSGTVHVANADLGSLSESGLASWRGRNVGLVFQFFQLLPTLTVIENVMLPMDFASKILASKRRGRALQLLERVGVADEADKMPVTLSGGQRRPLAHRRYGLRAHVRLSDRASVRRGIRSQNDLEDVDALDLGVERTSGLAQTGYEVDDLWGVSVRFSLGFQDHDLVNTA